MDIKKSKDDFIKVYKTNITRDGADKMLEFLEGSDFFVAPASTRFHEAYEGGLCVHSLNVYREAIRLAKAYENEIKTSYESLTICSLLHDVCKIGCYKTQMRNVKENGVWVQKPFYTWDEDFCFGGHGSKSVYMIQKFMDLKHVEAVAINCHMGSWDRDSGDYSISNAFTQYPIAWLIHAADEASNFVTDIKLTD